jgi:hypothetical protein
MLPVQYKQEGFQVPRHPHATPSLTAQGTEREELFNPVEQMSREA